jgi:aspartyl-tRNA(Asn)/glutamyl-tRNA(Gln) amidotransferase subunit A
MRRPPATLCDAAAAVRSGEVSSTELFETALARAAEWEPGLGAFADRYDAQAREAAAAADEDAAAGRDLGPLQGVPLAIKDILAAKEGPTRAGSRAADLEWERGRDAVAVARLRDAGAIVLCKATTMEYATGLPDLDGPFPIPRNPWGEGRYPGGSSSGSAVGVAARIFLGAVGTDSGGSIRIPSAFCGVSGLKPTYGRVPRVGCIPLADSLDHIGPIAPSARDCAALLEVMAGPDEGDPTATSLPLSIPIPASPDLEGVRIGLDRLSGVASEYRDPAVDRALDAAMEELAGLGAEVVPVELPLYDELTDATIAIMVSEAAAFHEERMNQRPQDLTAALRSILATHKDYTGADYVRAQSVREVGRDRLRALYATQGLDAIVTPTIGCGSPPLNEAEDFALGEKWKAIFTMYWNAAGFPVLSVPIGFDESSMPLGMQIAGLPFDEASVVRIGDAFQSGTDWHLREPSPPGRAQGPS